MNNDELASLRIASNRKRRSGGTWWWIVTGVLVATGAAAYLAYPRPGDANRSGLKSGREAAVSKADKDLANRARLLASERSGVDDSGAGGGGAAGKAPAAGSANRTALTEGGGGGGGSSAGSVLTVSGYLVARERIELSPRFLGVVTWIGVKKGDSVTNGQVVVRLDDAEYRARRAEIDAQTAVAQVAVDRARVDLKRAQELVSSRVEMQKLLDDARLSLAAAEAQVQHSIAGRELINTYIDWCVIRSPVNGVVLEKLVDPNELVSPQTFGSGRGPSTSLIALADLTDLQVEIDVNEADLGKVTLGQRCVVSPEAYQDKEYAGVVAEIAPEANRAKGTLSVKVKIENPDRFLTPELSAKVKFLGTR